MNEIKKWEYFVTSSLARYMIYTTREFSIKGLEFLNKA